MFGYREKSSPADTAAIWAIVLLAAAVAVLVGIYFARQNNFWGLGSAPDDTIVPNVITPAEETSATKNTEETTLSTTSVTTETTTETETSISLNEEIPTEYDKEFFDSVLMVGDSLSVGFVNYGYLNTENVFAQVGLTPASVMTAEINGETVYAKAQTLSPKHICIMLGTNGLSYLSEDYMAEKMGEFIDELRLICPDAEIAIISIPPVTEVHESEKPEKIENITNYNTHIAKVAEDKSAAYIDIFTLLKDENGYLADHYAENDGLHFKTYAYPVILSAVQSAVGADFSLDDYVPTETSATVTAPSETASTAAVALPAETAVTYAETQSETETSETSYETEALPEETEIFEVTIYPEDWDEIY